MNLRYLIILMIFSAAVHGQSFISVTQSNNANHVTLAQIGNHSLTINQNGLMNFVSSFQSGTNNQLTVDQSQYSYGSQLFSNQIGLNNLSSLFQTNYDNKAVLTQQGDNNTTHQYQNIGGVNTSYSEISQTSNGNTATTDQSNGTNLYSLIEQNGLSNSGIITQTGGSFASGHTARMWQYGNNNIASQTQSGVPGPGAFGNNANITQVYTSLSQATQNQSGAGNNSNISQLLGDNNFADVLQSGNSHYSYLSQIGANNIFRNTQDQGGSNYVNLYQTNGSQATINQHGSFNSLSGIENGILSNLARSLDGSILQLMQSGTSNFSRIFQLNNENSSISQTGSNNTVNLEQH